MTQSGGQADNKVNVTINGRTVATDKGRLIIDVAEEMGIFVPRFCYHPGMKSVAVCRMCLVQVEGQRKLLPACATPADDGMNVNTVDPEAVDAQTGMLEFLLINHPLDCPICDRAGECPLQDQTFRHGPGSSRYVEPKRTYEKALEISELVVLDRERCVLCWRCVRFCDEVSGDSFIQLVDRGAGTQILTFSDEPFDSYFSGNTIQICPVGALLSKPYRFVSRPWDLKTAPSVCSYCSVGCPITNESREEKVVRCQALPNENVNDFWICDKGRFGYHYLSSDDRLKTPLLRGEDDRFESTSWNAAFQAAGEKLKGAERVGVIAGGHLTTEDAYAIGRLAKEVIGTRNVDSRIQDAGVPYEATMQLHGAVGSSAKNLDLDDAKAIVWIGSDPKEVVPVLYLRLRRCALDGGSKLIVVSPRALSLDNFANTTIRTDLSDGDSIASSVREALQGVEGKIVVAWAPGSPGRDESASLRAAVDIAGDNGGYLLTCPPHAGSQGLLDMGVHPGVDAGYVPVEDPGMDTRAILEAAAAGDLDALVIAGADPIADFPDADLARRALASGVSTIVMELFPTETVSFADVVLPSSAYAEREGTFINLERRIQKLERLVGPPGTARDVWSICEGIAGALGTTWKWDSFSDVWADIRKNVPTHANVDVDALTQELPESSPVDATGFSGESSPMPLAIAGPGGQYPKGYRAGAPFQTGQNWPLSWELRAFEAKQRPGVIPAVASGEDGSSGGTPSLAPLRKPSSPPARADDAAQATSNERGSHSFELLSGRFIYDEGAMVSRSVALRNLQKKPFVEMNDEDVKELGLADGDAVRLSVGDVDVTLELRIADIVRGSVFVPYDQQGLRANTLMRGGSSRVKVERA